MNCTPDKPWNDLPPLPPSHPLETPRVLKRCIQARASLAELNALAQGLPDPSVLINTIPLLEAQASSEIENIVTTSDELFRTARLDEDRADPATKEAFRYRAALAEGYRTLKRRPVSTATAVEVCRLIKGVNLDVRRVPGTQLVNDATGEIIYTPPVGEDLLRQKLANWERFLNEEKELDPLVRMAAGHYQFEAIHPFIDGNGRTGRVLNLLFLVQESLLEQPILYLSGHINRTRDDYYAKLQAVTFEEAWEDWILYLLDAVRETSRWTSDKIRATQTLRQRTIEYVQAELPRIYSRELIDVLFMQPYCRIENLIEAGIAKRETASRYLHALTGIGVLAENKVGRDKLFLNTRFMTLLTRDSNRVRPF